MARHNTFSMQTQHMVEKVTNFLWRDMPGSQLSICGWPANGPYRLCRRVELYLSKNAEPFNCPHLVSHSTYWCNQRHLHCPLQSRGASLLILRCTLYETDKTKLRLGCIQAQVTEEGQIRPSRPAVDRKQNAACNVPVKYVHVRHHELLYKLHLWQFQRSAPFDDITCSIQTSHSAW